MWLFRLWYVMQYLKCEQSELNDKKLLNEDLKCILNVTYKDILKETLLIFMK